MEEEVSNFNFDKVMENQNLMLENKIQSQIKASNEKSINVSKICCDCDEQIDERRLAALPHALRCIDCATDFENKSRFKKGLNSTRSIIENMNT